MEVPFKTQRTRLTTGVYTSELSSAEKLRRLAASHPFVQQLDVLVASEDAFKPHFEDLKTMYWACDAPLSTFVKYAREFVSSVELKSTILALGTSQGDDDVWCIDSRGVLALAVGKTTYERIGLVGERLPWKGCDDTFVIHVSLREAAPTYDKKTTAKWHRLSAKVMQALERWDAQREPWRILYVHSPATMAAQFTGASPSEVKPARQEFTDIHVPSSPRLHLPSPAEAGEAEDHAENISALFEWVGMACLGAQRLQVNDRVDPYVAVYAPPSPSRVGSVTHLRWTGLLAPHFVQSVIGKAVEQAQARPSSLVAVTLHGVPLAPVAYIPTSLSPAVPLRAPRPESEDTTCLILSGATSRPDGGGATCEWALVESIGQWDARWG